MEKTKGPAETFGEYLVRERRLRNIRLEEIVERTHISLETLQHLESDAYHKLPPRVYVNGFLRTYAGFVGLDENEVILRFEDALQGVNAAHTRTGMRWKGNQKPLLWILLIFLGLSLVAGYLYYRQRPSHRSRRHIQTRTFSNVTGQAFPRALHEVARCKPSRDAAPRPA